LTVLRLSSDGVVLRPSTLPSLRPTVVALAAILVSTSFGVALATRVPLGLALLGGVLYAVVVAVSVPVAVAAWVPLVFLEGFPSLNLAGKAGGLLLFGGWIGFVASRAAPAAALRRHRRLLEVLAILLVWLSLSVAWAPDVGRSWTNLWQWGAVVSVFVVVATAVVDARAVRFVMGAFVAGGVASVATSAAAGNAGAVRLEAAAGDPNFLAAGLIPCIAFAAAMIGSTKRPLERLLFVVAIVVLAAGVVLTESRGALVAGLTAAVTAFVVFRRRRAHVVGLAVLVVVVGGLLFAAAPAAWERVSQPDTRGSGRSDLWTVAWRVADDHPFLGVGINNFGAVAGDYVREPGLLFDVGLIAEDPHTVHNLYLQLLAENGIPGVSLFAIFAVACLAAALSAARRLERRNHMDLGVLARAVIVAGAALLASGFFLSSQVDRRLWIVLALGPAFDALSIRLGSAHAPTTDLARR
jgi:O-antigen ligase